MTTSRRRRAAFAAIGLALAWNVGTSGRRVQDLEGEIGRVQRELAGAADALVRQ